MRNNQFPIKATLLAFALAGSALQVQAASAATSINMQLNALAAGSCTVTPAASSVALPAATVGSTFAAWQNTTNFPLPSVFGGTVKTSAALDQILHLVCGSTVSILSMAITPLLSQGPSWPGAGMLKDSAGLAPWGNGATATNGPTIYTELVSISGTSTPYSFVNLAGASQSYTNAFSVGTSPVSVVWRPAVSIGYSTGVLAAPASGSGYRSDLLITINY